MASPSTTTPSPASLRPPFQYPFAAAPDIIRSHQKDAYFQGILLESLTSAVRSLYGARVAHRYSTEARSLADLLYLCCTTAVGNRTLGEEYCDIVQVDARSLRLPSALQRAAYILSSVLLPYALGRSLPGIRARLAARLETEIAAREQSGRAGQQRVRRYLLRNLGTITSPAPLYALGLAVFYFGGAYYHISKRVCGLRYVFTTAVDPSEQRVGYEVLGVLLVLQLGVQAYLHVLSTLDPQATAPSIANPSALDGGSALLDGGVEVSLGGPGTGSSEMLLEAPAVSGASKESISAHTATPVLGTPRYQLGEAATMRWIEGRQQRKCTLCLEELRDPSATTCGHVFCWSCIADWIREKPECPLCRQGIMAQHVLPLRE